VWKESSRLRCPFILLQRTAFSASGVTEGLLAPLSFSRSTYKYERALKFLQELRKKLLYIMFTVEIHIIFYFLMNEIHIIAYRCICIFALVYLFVHVSLPQWDSFNPIIGLFTDQ
jgi:hypothetical protein